MEFTTLKEAVEYAKENKQDVQKQGDIWVTINKPIIPLEQIIEDTERVLEQEKAKENPDTELITQIEQELEELKSSKE